MKNIFTILITAIAIFNLGCSSFSLKISKNSAHAYLNCFKSPGGTCPGIDEKSDIAATIIAGYQFDEKTSTFEPVSTAPRKNFKNPFSSQSKGTDLLFKDVGIKGEIPALYRQELYKKTEEVLDIMNHPMRVKIDEVYNAMVNPEKEIKEISFNLKSLSVFTKKIKEATLNNSFEAYKIATLIAWDTEAEGPEKEAALKDLAIGSALEKYFKAYMRNGQFASVQLSISDFVTKFPFLKDYPPNVLSQIEAALKQVDSKLKFGRIGDEGFVTRFGTKYAFPPIELQFTPGSERFATVSEVDFVKIGNELIRLFIEAIFDGHDRLPAVADATGVKAGFLKSFPDVIDDYKKRIAEEDFDDMNERANMVEGAVSSIISKVIRGFSFFSINNEAVETLIENAIGVISRKAYEKADWCWHSCGLSKILNDQKAEKINEFYYQKNLAAFPGTVIERKDLKNRYPFSGPAGEYRNVKIRIYYW